MEENKNVDFEKLEPHDRLKYENAEELGLLEKVREGGWKALSSRETGRICGMIVPNKLRNRIMDTVNEKHGLKTDAQAIVCSLNVDHFAPI